MIEFSIFILLNYYFDEIKLLSVQNNIYLLLVFENLKIIKI